MQKHKELREKFGNVLETDNAIEVLEAIEQWLIERDNQALRIHGVVRQSEQLPCEMCGGNIDKEDKFSDEKHCENCGWF